MERGHLDVGLARARAALQKGATLEGTTLKVNAAADCERPAGFQHAYTRGAHQVPAGTRPGHTDVSLFIEGEARCRRCPTCLAYKRKMWTARAMRELQFAQRTWFGTITLNPAARFRLANEARQTCRKSGVDYDAQDTDTQFRDVVRMLNTRVTRWLKRVREESEASLRYLLVVERHRDGSPHLHCLVHERPGSVPVSGRVLSRQWSELGFTQFRLVKAGPDQPPGRVAYYVCKYLAKDPLSRIRASLAYGEPAASVDIVSITESVDAQSPTASAIAGNSVENNDPSDEVTRTVLGLADE